MRGGDPFNLDNKRTTPPRGCFQLKWFLCVCFFAFFFFFPPTQPPGWLGGGTGAFGFFFSPKKSPSSTSCCFDYPNPKKTSVTFNPFSQKVDRFFFFPSLFSSLWHYTLVGEKIHFSNPFFPPTGYVCFSGPPPIPGPRGFGSFFFPWWVWGPLGFVLWVFVETLSFEVFLLSRPGFFFVRGLTVVGWDCPQRPLFLLPPPLNK